MKNNKTRPARTRVGLAAFLLVAGALTFITHPGDLIHGGTPRLSLLGGAATFLDHEAVGWKSLR